MIVFTNPLLDASGEKVGNASARGSLTSTSSVGTITLAP
jgi:hypothetical protein